MVIRISILTVIFIIWVFAMVSLVSAQDVSSGSQSGSWSQSGVSIGSETQVLQQDSNDLCGSRNVPD